MTLDEKTVTLITETAIKVYKKERETELKREKDNRLHNIKLLLKNYKRLEQFIEKTEIKEEADMTVEEMMKSDNVIESIKASTARTKLMFEYVDKTLDRFKVVTANEDNKLLYNVIRLRYIERQKVDVIAANLCIDRRQVYRLIDEASGVLSVLMFGVDALEFK